MLIHCQSRTHLRKWRSVKEEKLDDEANENPSIKPHVELTRTIVYLNVPRGLRVFVLDVWQHRKLRYFVPSSRRRSIASAPFHLNLEP
ncbi:hypothetical protein TNIN_393971 [Trichonephila inaurata madagascariensis]|uniref:Uncharacterized protein n=1 Tax=Trichonephila inaurata madagascariensis TaxID=2747483 RepID=A0A8X7CJ04_9ARAC|nr:hypothetical protein TNIN_393971 [Trichonephila inaurata madagascariensis]